MPDDLMFSVNTVAPLLLVMLAGFLARRLRIMDDAGVRQANSAVFHIFLPILLCMNIADTPAGLAVDIRTLLYGFLGVFASFMLLFAVTPRLCKSRDTRGVFIQGVARSNYAIFGIPLIMLMYPSAETSVAALMVVVVVPLFNIMSTVALMTYRKREASVWSMARGVLTNPLIIGTALGFALWRLQVPLPAVLTTPLKLLGGVATPLALFLLGASIDFSKAQANLRLLTLGVLGRLVLLPTVFLGGAVLLGIRDVSLATLIAVFASPTAVSSYPMAQQIGGDADFAAAQVVFTTALSSVTVFLWVLLFRTLGFLG